LLRGRLESAIEGSACDENAQFLIEHDEGFADGIHDGFFEGPTLRGAGHGIFPNL
jgi:hypothetical protein